MQKISGIYGLCDNSLNPERSHLEIAKGLLAGGVRILQLRMKGEKDLQHVTQTANSILKLKQSYPFTFILNDFVHLALELGADGLHVGQDDMPLKEIRKLAGEDFLVGYSSHSPEEAKAAETLGASYVALGAIFPTATKGPGHPVVGISTLKSVVEELNIPVVAIGGIDKSNFTEVRNTGAAAIAMIGALTTPEDMTEAARWFTKHYEINPH